MKTAVPVSVAIRKAAILVATLDPRQADALLDKMPEDFAARVRQLSVEIEDFTREEQDDVIREFVRAGGGDTSEPEMDGVELQLSSASVSRKTDYDGHRPEVYQSSAPFGFLRDARADVLARHLAPQHPQVIAVVVAHLPPSQAADLVKRFASKLQADVLRRVAELDLTDEESVRDVERELESMLSDELRIAKNRQVGLANVQTILASAGDDRSRLLHSLARHHQELAEQIDGTGSDASERHRSARGRAGVHEDRDEVRRGRVAGRVGSPPARHYGTAPAQTVEYHESPEGEHDERLPQDADLRVARSAPAKAPSISVEFEELSGLSDEGWAALIRAAEPGVILVALTGASEPLLKRMTQRLTKQEAQTLRQRLQHPGPLRLSDIELAQRQLALLAARLAERGVLRLPDRRGFAAAA